MDSYVCGDGCLFVILHYYFRFISHRMGKVIIQHISALHLWSFSRFLHSELKLKSLQTSDFLSGVEFQLQVKGNRPYC